ncbi:MAG: hypothetical protein O8C59_02615 [Candidatus Methanoperedens sp.]|nr:hypothetical protein [Candidatus Methanoperedens sp.]
MRNIKLISIFLIILSLIFIGCVQKPEKAQIPKATPGEFEKETPIATNPDVTSTVRTPSVYKSYVDDVYGFFRVISINDNQSSAPYIKDNKTLTIFAGDKVIWVNDADERLTIVSEQGLWDLNNTKARLLYQTSDFNYTFTRPGIYGVYLKEYSGRLAHQKIIVNP